VGWVRKAASQGQREAEYLLGALYAIGSPSLKKDHKAAVLWLRRAARQEHAEAQFALGLAYADGHGVQKDANEALGWLLESSRSGHQQAAQLVDRIKAGLKPREPAEKPNP